MTLTAVGMGSANQVSYSCRNGVSKLGLLRLQEWGQQIRTLTAVGMGSANQDSYSCRNGVSKLGLLRARVKGWKCQLNKHWRTFMIIGYGQPLLLFSHYDLHPANKMFQIFCVIVFLKFDISCLIFQKRCFTDFIILTTI